MSNSLIQNSDQTKNNTNSNDDPNSQQKTKNFFEFLQAQLAVICKEIELNLPLFRKGLITTSNRHKSDSISNERTINNQCKINEYQSHIFPSSKSPSYSPASHSPSSLHFSREITKNKKSINEFQMKIEAVEAIENITSIESAIKKKIDQLKTLSFENSTLKLIKHNQTKGEAKLPSNSINRNELIALAEKSKRMREEIKVNKDFNSTLAFKAKSQESQMTVIEKKCQIIKENIEYKQRQQMSLLSIDRGEEEQKDFDKFNKPEFFYEQCVISEKLFLNEENEYKARIKNQKEKIDQLDQEIKVLSSEISHIDKKAYQYEWEMKKEERANDVNFKEKKDDNNINVNTKLVFNGSLVRSGGFNNNSKPITIKDSHSLKPFAINKGLNAHYNSNTVGIGGGAELTGVDIGNNDHELIIEIEALSKSLFLFINPLYYRKGYQEHHCCY